jgi:hypothetical protein
MFSLYVTHLAGAQYAVAVPSLASLQMLCAYLQLSPNMTARVWDHKHRAFIR